jgi:Subtilase family/PA domain
VSQQTSLARSVGAEPERHFTVAANGFVADLTGAQAFELSSDRDVLVLSKDVARHTDTWNTPDFLGLSGPRGAWQRQAGGPQAAGDGVVVGVIDSGIWPESKSFSGSRLTRSPKTRWKISRVGDHVRMKKSDGGVFLGRCQLSHRSAGTRARAKGWKASDCTTKLIGARYYPDAFLAAVPRPDRSPHEFLSTRDGDGHGSHTAGTAAGNRVADVRTEGVRFGDVSGMAPAARVAAYKVCFDDRDEETGDCFGSAILSAIDDAVADGVDVINMSISGVAETVVDPVEIAFEGAAEAGIFVATSAGNDGPGASTVAHNSPWLTTVAASTHNNFVNSVVLGNGRKIRGASITPETLPQTRLISAARAAAPGAEPEAAALCFLGGVLDPAKVEGRIVVCERGINDRVDKSKAVKKAGGVGMILANVAPGTLDADFHSVPTVHISDTDSPKVFRYLDKAGRTATAAFKRGDLTSQRPTPVPQIAVFSSRGPATANESDVLKPDITAPGVNVLAAVAPPANEERKFNLYSGTSMASPHIAGLAAFMMAERRSWTPMQVKSAMMTTATNLRGQNGGRVTNPFTQGAGQVRIKKAFSPGLFINSGTVDWRGFLAGQGLPTGYEPIAAKDFNGPSLAQGQVTGSTSFTRTFTADRAGTWKVSVDLPGFSHRAPGKLVSRGKGDRIRLRLDLSRTNAPLGRWATGFLRLDGPTSLRLPIAVRSVPVKAPSEVSGTAVTGAVDIPVTAGFTGNLNVGVSGLAKAQSFTGSSSNISNSPEDAQFFCVQVGAGSTTARFSLDAANDAADMDLFVYSAADAACESLTDVVGVSATAAADESVTLDAPAPGSYLVEVDPFAPAPGEPTLNWRLDFFDVRPTNQVGGFQAVPNPVPVVQNQPTTFQAQWAGLEPGARYLGALEYEGALSPTYVTVDTTVTP